MWCGCIQSATQELSKTAATNNNAQQNSPNVTTARCCCQCYSNSKFIRNKHNSNNNNNTNSNSNSKNSINISINNKSNVWGLAEQKLATATSKKHKISTHINLTLLLVTMTLAVLLQTQQITASPLQHTTLAASVPTLTMAHVIGTDINMQRLHKRHSNWHEQYAREINSQEIEWANPCGGEWSQNLTELPVQPHRTPVKKVLRMLQNSTGKEQKTIKAITPAINISDMRMWSLHKDSYKFLPVLKLNSNVALRRWHRQMQLYVASFAYLRRAQIKWDHVKLHRESEISKELLKLMQSARRFLCEIETAINNTSAQGRNTSGVQKRPLRLNFLSRDAMEKRLKFQTNIRHLFAAQAPHHQRHQHQSDELQEVNPIDLKFVKFRYFNFLRAILKILRRHTRRAGEVNLDSRSASSAASASKQDNSLLINSLDESRAISTNSREMTLNQSQNDTTNRRNKPVRRRKPNKRNNDGNAANVSHNTSSQKNSRKTKQPQLPTP